MDHAEEQAMELEAIEAIYGDDYKKLEENTSGGIATFEVTLVPEAGADEDVNHVSVAMRVAFTATYPEAPPELSVRVVRRGAIMDEMVGEFEKELREAATSEELLGQPMVYALAEKVQEWLVEHNKPEMDMHSEMMARLAVTEAQSRSSEPVDVSDDAGGSGKQRGKGGKEPEGSWRANAGADALNQALTGEFTPVTPESFMAWRKDFEARQLAAAAMAKAGSGRGSQNTKAGSEGVTGRRLFEGGSILLDSDAGALEEGEEDMMSAPRVAADEQADEPDEPGEAGEAAAAAGGSTLLDTVGDEALFDEDEELPDDDDDE